MTSRNDSNRPCPIQDDALAKQIWDDPALLEALSGSEETISDKKRIAKWHQVAWSAAACFLIATLTFFLLPPQTNVMPSDTTASVVLATGTAEQEQFELEDGSHIHSNASTSLSVVFSTQIRQVSMEKGEAYFNVAKDAARPFEISTDFGKVTVLGTSFNVDTDSTGMEIKVFEGVVKVAPADGQAVTLTVGQRLGVDRFGNMSSVTSFDHVVKEDWMSGMLHANSMSMRQIVDRINRHTDKPVYLAPGLSGYSVTGTFSLSKPTDSLAMLSELYDLKIEESHNSYYLTPQ